MTPRGFDRYMVVVGAGRNRKFVRFTDSERCAHFLGVLSIAAQSPRRGYLLISDGEEAGPEEIANEAAVPVRVARSALEKLKRVGVLLRDETAGAWRVHDWDYVNPPPGSSTERVRRFRNGKRNADVTAGVSEALQDALPEGEVEGEESSSPTAQKTTRARRRVDQSLVPDGFSADLLPTLHEVLRILRRIWEVRGGVEPQPRGVGLAILRQPTADHRQVALQLEHWLTAGKGQRASCKDVTSRYGDWVADATDATRSSVVPLSRSAAVRSANDFQRFYQQDEAAS